MNGFSTGGGAGRWSMKDSANSFAQYHLATGESMSGKPGDKASPNAFAPLAKAFKQLFFISFAIGLVAFLGAGMNGILVVLLAAGVGTLIVLLFVGIIWLVVRRMRKKNPSQPPDTVP